MNCKKVLNLYKQTKSPESSSIIYEQRAKSLFNYALHSNKKYYFCDNLRGGMSKQEDYRSRIAMDN